MRLVSTATTPMSAPSAMRPRCLWVSRWECPRWRRGLELVPQSAALSDTGAGVAPEHLPRLFDRFHRADAARDRQHGAAGIGLSIAKALVEAHDGQIEAHSGGHGTGSTFSVTLPCWGSASRLSGR